MKLFYCNRPSNGLKKLRERTDIKKWKKKKITPEDIIINWGCTVLPLEFYNAHIINHPDEVHKVVDKIEFCNNIFDPIIPPWSTDRKHAEGWINSGYKVVCRTLTRAHGGRGIVLATNLADLVDAPLYTQYIPKKEEYRVHIFQGMLISIQQKLRRKDHPAPNWMVRSYENGFIYARNDLNTPECVIDIAKKVMKSTRLDFGAVDVIYNQTQRRAYALEINTAPGVEGATVDAYSDALLSL